MPTLPFRVTQTGVSSTAGFTATLFPDTMIRPFAMGIGCTVTSTALTYSVQHSFDYTGSSTFISSNASWFTNTGISSVAGLNADGNYIVPVSAVRLNVTTGTTAASTASVTMTCIQAG